MNTRHTMYLALAAGTCLIGCRQPDAATDEDYDAVAQGIGTAVSDGQGGGDIGSMGDALDLSANSLPDGFSQDGSGEYVGVRGSLSYSYDITCLDDANAAPSPCGETTDIANLTLSWTGDINLPRLQASVERTGDWTVSGLTGDTATFNGQGTFHLDSEFTALYTNRSRTLTLDYVATYGDILIDTLTRSPVGGTATFDVSAERTASSNLRDVEASFDISVEVTFAADGTATLTLDGSRFYELTLADGTVRRIEGSLNFQ